MGANDGSLFAGVNEPSHVNIGKFPMVPILTSLQATLFIIGYGLIISFLVVVFARGIKNTKLDLLVANREITKIPAAFSIADSWIWAPALFLSAEKAYTQGWVGLFWFTVPNVACLFLFAFFAQRMRLMYPEGFTCSGYMHERYSKRVQIEYVFAHGGLAACSFAVQLLAGGTVISSLSGLSFFQATVLLAAVPIAYTFITGIRGSVVSDFIQLSLVFLIGAVIIPWAIIQGGGLEVVWNGMNGISHKYTSLVSPDGWNVFLTLDRKSVV
jgi:urea-proton symporter